MSGVEILQLFGIIYLTLGLGFLIHPTFYKKMMADIMQSKASIFIMAILGIILGYALLGFGNDENMNIILFLNLIGLIALIKGVLFLIMPQMMGNLGQYFIKDIKKIKLIGVLIGILGIVVAYFGFFG